MDQDVEYTERSRVPTKNLVLNGERHNGYTAHRADSLTALEEKGNIFKVRDQIVF